MLKHLSKNAIGLLLGLLVLVSISQSVFAAENYLNCEIKSIRKDYESNSVFKPSIQDDVLVFQDVKTLSSIYTRDAFIPENAFDLQLLFDGQKLRLDAQTPGFQSMEKSPLSLSFENFMVVGQIDCTAVSAAALLEKQIKGRTESKAFNYELTFDEAYNQKRTFSVASACYSGDQDAASKLAQVSISGQSPVLSVAVINKTNQSLTVQAVRQYCIRESERECIDGCTECLEWTKIPINIQFNECVH